MTKKHLVVGNQIFRKVAIGQNPPIHQRMERGMLSDPYELTPEDVGKYIDQDFGQVQPSDVGRQLHLRGEILQMESMEQAETRRRKEGAPVGPPVELEFDDEEEEFEPDEDDAYMKPAGPLYSKIHLTVEGKSHGEFSSEEEAKDYLAKWTEANQFWPNLWFIDDHGGLNGPVLYGEGAEDAGPGRQEGATYRRGSLKTAEILEQGQYVTFERLPNGDLKMIATDAFRNEFLPYQNFDPEAYAEDERWGDNFDYYRAIRDLIEDIVVNSNWDWVEPAAIDALTDAPIITDDMDYPDSGEVAPHPEANIWWYPSYAIRAFIDDLIRDGETVFTYVPVEEESVQASTRTAQEDFILPEENEGEFPFDVSLLDDTVTGTLQESGPEHNDFDVFVEEVDASAVGDLDEAERTINDASVLTTVGGRYSLEIEGGMVNVFFEAEAHETDKLQETFMPDDDGEEDIGNFEYEG